MAYTITKSDGTTLATISDGTVNTVATNLSLPGPNYVGYGQALNENLVYLLENFASNSAPTGVNIQGQLWFDKAHQTLNVFTSAGYSPVSGVTASSSQPIVQKDGDIWFSTTTNQLYVSVSGTFNLIGPLYTKSTGPSGAIPVVVNDGSTTGIVHNIVKLQFGNTTIATFSTDVPFLPSPPIPGFTYINPGITLNNTLSGTSLNSNVSGTLTGTVNGTLFGNVVGTALTGTLTGNVVGNLVGNVTATTLSGSLSGDVTSTNGRITNFVSGNAQITGGNVTGLTNLTATNSTLTNLNTGTLFASNLSVSNLVVAGGSISGLSLLSVGTLVATNFSSANAQITGGFARNLANISATTGQLTNFSTSNIQATGGSVYNLSNVTATNTQTTNFSSGNAIITGGSTTGLTAVSATTAQANNFSSANAQITGGNVSNAGGSNNTFTTANLLNSTATTKAYSDSSTAIATTAFVQNVLPRGMIVMWGGLVGAIPTGWQLCDGSNSTPDLRGQFIVGAGGTYTTGNTGGASSITLTTGNLPAHTHLASLTGATDQNGSHNHTVIDPGHIHSLPSVFNQSYPNSFVAGYGGAGQVVSQTGSATTGISLALSPTHSHNVTLTGNVGSTGSGQSIDTRPPFYALCYIQKMF